MQTETVVIATTCGNIGCGEILYPGEKAYRNDEALLCCSEACAEVRS